MKKQPKERKPKVGDKIWINSDQRYSKDSDNSRYCVITAILDSVIFCRPKYSRGEEIHVEISNIDYVEPEKIKSKKKKKKLPKLNQPISNSERETIIRRLVKEESLNESGGMVREIMVFYKLYRKLNDLEFWQNFTPAFQVRSLLYWLNTGYNDLRVFFNKNTLDISSKTPQYNLSQEKIGEDIVTKKKIKSILDLD